MDPANPAPAKLLMDELNAWIAMHRPSHLPVRAAWRAAFEASDTAWAQLADAVLEWSTLLSVDFMAIHRPLDENQIHQQHSGIAADIQALVKHAATTPSIMSRLVGRSEDHHKQEIIERSRELETRLGELRARTDVRLASLTQTTQLATLLSDASRWLLDYAPTVVAQLHRPLAVADPKDMVAYRVHRRREEMQHLAVAALKQVLPLLENFAPEAEKMASSLRQSREREMKAMGGLQEDLSSAMNTAKHLLQGQPRPQDSAVALPEPARRAGNDSSSRNSYARFMLPFLRDSRIPMVSKPVADALIRISKDPNPVLRRRDGTPAPPHVQRAAKQSLIPEVFILTQEEVRKIADSPNLHLAQVPSLQGGHVPAACLLLQQVHKEVPKFWPPEARKKIEHSILNWLEGFDGKPREEVAREFDRLGLDGPTWFGTAHAAVNGHMGALGLRMLAIAPMSPLGIQASISAESIPDGNFSAERACGFILGAAGVSSGKAAGDLVRAIDNLSGYRLAAPELVSSRMWIWPTLFQHYAASVPAPDLWRYATVLHAVALDGDEEGFASALLKWSPAPGQDSESPVARLPSMAHWEALEKLCAVSLRYITTPVVETLGDLRILPELEIADGFLNIFAAQALNKILQSHLYATQPYVIFSCAMQHPDATRRTLERTESLRLDVDNPHDDPLVVILRGRSCTSLEQARSLVWGLAAHRPTHASSDFPDALKQAISQNDFHAAVALVEKTPNIDIAQILPAMKQVFAASSATAADWLEWLSVAGLVDDPPGLVLDTSHPQIKPVELLAAYLQRVQAGLGVETHEDYVAHVKSWAEYLGHTHQSVQTATLRAVQILDEAMTMGILSKDILPCPRLVDVLRSSMEGLLRGKDRDLQSAGTSRHETVEGLMGRWSTGVHRGERSLRPQALVYSDSTVSTTGTRRRM